MTKYRTVSQCNMADCEVDALARGLCKNHYERAWRAEALPPKKTPYEKCVDRFWANLAKTHDCWVWLGTYNSQGYGQLAIDQRPIRAHRFAYELLVGPIPEGLVLDHLCRVRHCVNPDHLEAVTSAENIRRGKGNGFKEITHCKHGHEYNEENTIRTPKGLRRCRECKQKHSAATLEVLKGKKKPCEKCGKIVSISWAREHMKTSQCK